MRLLIIGSLLVAAASVSADGVACPSPTHSPGVIHMPKKPKNLRVLRGSGTRISRGMKDMSRALGVKCSACHAESDHASDAKPEKELARRFFVSVMADRSVSSRTSELEKLLRALRIERAEDEGDVWAAIAEMSERKED